MTSGLTAAACCLLASLAACTSLDLPPAPAGYEDGGHSSGVTSEGGTVDEESDHDPDGNPADAPIPPLAKVDSGLVAKDAGKQTSSVDSGSADTAPPATDAGIQAPTSAPDAGKPTPNPTPDAGTTPPVVTPPVVKDAGVTPPVTVDPPPTQPPVTVMSVVPGSAIKAQCSSYVLANGSMCGGYFCGVTQAQIAAELPADNLCGSNAAAGACDNKLPKAVALCARNVKSANALATNAELRPLMQDCVLKDADLKAKTPLACVTCYLDAADCRNDNCLVDCLTGDSKGCDTCAAKNGCHTKALLCAKLPSPF